MYRILSASKDTYITDKIINSAYRATDANMGQAGTLDLFKIYDETLIRKITFREKDFPLSPTEIPREQICYKFFPWQIDKKIHAGNPWMPLLASHFASIMSVHSWVLK